jgi:hypothetical protein
MITSPSDAKAPARNEKTNATEKISMPLLAIFLLLSIKFFFSEIDIVVILISKVAFIKIKEQVQLKTRPCLKILASASLNIGVVVALPILLKVGEV